MNRYVIDTHIFLWLVFEPNKVEKTKLQLLKNPKNKVFIADISFWEISLKFNLGKLDLEGLMPDELPSFAEKMGIEILNMDQNIMATFYKLPKMPSHKDPFDRIIIWKCIHDKITLVSKDRKFAEYQSFGLSVL